MTVDAKALESFPLFDGLGPEVLGTFAAMAHPERIPSGQVVFELGGAAEKFYVLLHGAVNLTMPIQIGGQAQDAFVEEIRSGVMFGWSALVRPHRYTMSARAPVDAEVLSWSGAEVWQVLSKDPATGLRLMDNLATRMCQRLHRVQAMWLREIQRVVTAKMS